MDNLEYKLRYDKNVPIAELTSRISQLLEIYENFVIVEGIDDIAFYYHTELLKCIEDFKIITAPYDSYDNVVGKKYVINAFKYLKIANKLSKQMYRYVFIVDHDYDGISKYFDIEKNCFTDLLPLEQNCISCTKCYAIENYVLQKNNLEKVFKYFEIENDFINFWNRFNQFVRETKDLFALIATTVYAVKNNIKIPSIKIKWEEAFKDFDFSNSDCIYNKEKLIQAVEERLNVINNCKERKFLHNKKREYESLIEKENFIQGHVGYKFFQNYLKYYHDIDVFPNASKNQKYVKMLENIDVDIDLKYGNGKLVNKNM